MYGQRFQLDISAEQMLILREFIWNTKLSSDMDTWAGQAGDLAALFEQIDLVYPEIADTLGRPEIVVTVSNEDGFDFQLR